MSCTLKTLKKKWVTKKKRKWAKNGQPHKARDGLPWE